MATSSKILITPRLLAILAFGFAAGLPLNLIGSTLQAWFTEAHVNLMTIGALSLIGIPYTLKFLWAPMMDYYRIPVLGKRRGWIAITQVGLVIALLWLAFLNPSTSALQMGVVALAIAFFSASQDISVTAYQTDILHPEERGLGAAYYIFSYRLAVLLSGGFALIFADYMGWKLTYMMMALLLALCLIPTWIAPQEQQAARTDSSLFMATWSALTDLLLRDKILLILLFIIFYKIGDALALQLMTNFLLHGLGFSLTEVGLAYKIMSFIATVLGAFIGGIVLTRWNIYRALLVFGLAQAFSNLMFVLLAIVGKDFLLMASSIFIENFCSGLSTAALLAFMMSLCQHRYAATQFALLSAIASLGRVFLGPVASLMVEHLGWAQFYFWSFLTCVPGIVILLLLKNRVSTYAHATVK